jgi:hypothetical protein
MPASKKLERPLSQKQNTRGLVVWLRGLIPIMHGALGSILSTGKKKKKEESWRAQEGETPPQKSLVLKEDGQVVLSGPKGRTEKPSGTQEAST